MVKHHLNNRERIHGKTSKMVTLSTSFLSLALATFILGGFVKGFVGFGPPLVAVTILGPIYGIRTALALVIFPTVVMNIVQAFHGPHKREIIARLWPYLLTIAIGIWLGIGILARTEMHTLTILLGAMLLIYSVSSLFHLELPAPGRYEPIATPVMGGVSGLLAGVTGVYVFPTTLYLRSLGYERTKLIQAMGIVFLWVSVAIAISLGGRNLLPGNLTLLSAIVTIPALAGQWLGSRAAERLPDELFRRIFYVALGIVGFWITVRNFIL